MAIELAIVSIKKRQPATGTKHTILKQKNGNTWVSINTLHCHSILYGLKA